MENITYLDLPFAEPVSAQSTRSLPRANQISAQQPRPQTQSAQTPRRSIVEPERDRSDSQACSNLPDYPTIYF